MAVNSVDASCVKPSATININKISVGRNGSLFSTFFFLSLHLCYITTATQAWSPEQRVSLLIHPHIEYAAITLHTHTHMVHYTVGEGVFDGLAYQSVRVCEFVWEHAYVHLLYDEWWMVWWVYFTYRTTSSVKRSGLIALSQWTAGPSGSCVLDSFTWSTVNILEKSEITHGIEFWLYICS